MREIAMVAKRVHRTAQLIARRLAAATAEKPAHPFRRVRKNTLEPGIIGLISQRAGLVFSGDREERVDARLDRPLAQEIAAEGVDGSHPREFEFLERLVQAVFLDVAGRGASPFDLGAQPQLHFASGLFREGHRDDASQRRRSTSDQTDDASDERRGLSRTGSCLDEERRAELG